MPSGPTGNTDQRERGNLRWARASMVLTIIHFQLPFPLLPPASLLPQTHSYTYKHAWRADEAKRTSSVCRRRVLSAGPTAGPGLHCAHYSWQAWARERAPPSAAGILWAKLLVRIREEALHFVPVDDGGGGGMGRSGHSKQKFQGSNMSLFCCFVIERMWLWTQTWDCHWELKNVTPVRSG